MALLNCTKNTTDTTFSVKLITRADKLSSGETLPNISVSSYINQQLEEIKRRDGHTSKDSVIRMLWLKDKGAKVVCRRHNCLYNSTENCTAQIIEVDGGCNTYEPRSPTDRTARINVSPITLEGEKAKRELLY